MQHRVVNAAGKLTALGGSAQSEAVARTQAEAARAHVDLAALRRSAGETIATLTGAEAACVTSGAAAGIAIAVAATITGDRLAKVHALPASEPPNRVLLQAGHAVNFGAPVEQMIRLGGGIPTLVGSTNSVPRRLLEDVLAGPNVVAMLYVQSHHCVQDNMTSLTNCVELCRNANIPLIVDAAAEEDLTCYINAGADLVTYSGGKAFSGPTSGFIAGSAGLVANCELQFQGIARTMKVGKEAISGLLLALDEYRNADDADRRARFAENNRRLLTALANCRFLDASRKRDEAGRDFERVAIAARDNSFQIRDLVSYLAAGEPSIRTRNHHLDQGYLLVDPRELSADDIQAIAARLLAFDPAH